MAAKIDPSLSEGAVKELHAMVLSICKLHLSTKASVQLEQIGLQVFSSVCIARWQLSTDWSVVAVASDESFFRVIVANWQTMLYLSSVVATEFVDTSDLPMHNLHHLLRHLATVLPLVCRYPQFLKLSCIHMLPKVSSQTTFIQAVDAVCQWLQRMESLLNVTRRLCQQDSKLLASSFGSILGHNQHTALQDALDEEEVIEGDQVAEERASAVVVDDNS